MAAEDVPDRGGSGDKPHSEHSTCPGQRSAVSKFLWIAQDIRLQEVYAIGGYSR